jgi:hypothetical protein
MTYRDRIIIGVGIAGGLAILMASGCSTVCLHEAAWDTYLQHTGLHRGDDLDPADWDQLVRTARLYAGIYQSRPDTGQALHVNGIIPEGLEPGAATTSEVHQIADEIFLYHRYGTKRERWAMEHAKVGVSPAEHAALEDAGRQILSRLP